MAVLQEIKVPLLAVNDTTLTVAELRYSNGEKVAGGNVLMVFETSKTTFDVEAEADGYVQYTCEAGQDYEVGVVVATIFTDAAETATRPMSTAPSRSVGGPPVSPVPAENLPRWEGETIFSLEALRLLASAALDPASFTGRDFVTADDVRRLLMPATASASAPTPASPRSAPPPIPIDPNKVVLEKLAGAKKREIAYLGEVQTAGLTSTLNSFIETDGIFLLLNRSFKYLKDTLLPVIIYESSRLLKDYPLLNAYFAGDAIAIYKEVNPGFAIDIDKGLKVLKVAGAGEMSMTGIEAEILRLSGNYLDEKLQLEELTDISFTITDLSAEGVSFFQPLVNRMNSAILGVSAVDPRLQRCILSLTFDHRVTEGKVVARFLQELKQRIESYRPAAGAKRPDIACFKCFRTLDEDLGGTGFMHCITPEGKDGYICQSCLKGF
jgi:pyruvate/2-oxoglutarate dehydrogenase complex dihydrolipoamide acyltransferase (E2) component